VRYLLDTHVLLWALANSPSLSRRAQALIEDEANELLFSSISIAEIAIKFALGRPDFQQEPKRVRQTLLDNGYVELPLTGEHALALANLPPIHKDPFDRLLLAQARVEGVPLVTGDAVVEKYAGLVVRV
jgi:PIN domain nuclease of toxin-antitoxin system